MPARIAVVGAGATGLSSALRILQQFPASDVTVIADKFHMETTSTVAAGFVIPEYNDLPNPTHKLKQWTNDSLKRYTQLADGLESATSGVIFTSGYYLTDRECKEVSPYVRNFRTLGADELTRISKVNRFGYFYTTVMVECKYYLPWLTERVKELGGHVMRRKIHTFNELADDYDIIVNCAGLSNRELLDDQQMTSVRGQALRMKAPWLKHFVFDRSNLRYMFVGRDHVIVGGTYSRDDNNTQAEPRDTENVLREMEKLVPTIRSATIERIGVGLRPVRRTGIRLERQVVDMGGKKVQIVHNYGHGSDGIKYSWGTACEVATLVGQCLQQSKL